MAPMSDAPASAPTNENTAPTSPAAAPDDTTPETVEETPLEEVITPEGHEDLPEVDEEAASIDEKKELDPAAALIADLAATRASGDSEGYQEALDALQALEDEKADDEDESK